MFLWMVVASSCFCNLDENFADDLMTRTKTEQLKLRSGLVLVPLFKPQIRSDQIRLSVTVEGDGWYILP